MLSTSPSHWSRPRASERCHVWDVRYRPAKFSEAIGQEGTVQVLRARLRNGTGSDTSYIFSGGHGQGKTTLARILARALLCENLQNEEPCNQCSSCMDVFNEASPAFAEMDAASRGTIDVARGIVEDIAFVLPGGGGKRIYLFDEAHRMSRDAQDVLLKPIEDKKLVAIFCTTEPEKIRGPIRSRCESYAIRKVSREELLQRMKWVLDQEKVEHEDDAVLTVIDYSGGHVRDILNRLEMVAQLGPITLTSVREYLRLGLVSVYFETLLSLGDPARAVALIEQACEQADPADVSTGLAEAAMNAYRVANNLHVDFSQVDRDLAKKVFDTFGASTTELASYFIDEAYPTKISLTCKVVRCARGIPRGAPVAVVAPPVVVQTTMLPQTSVPVAAVPAPIAAPPPVASAPTPPTPPPSSDSKNRLNGKGNLGSTDKQALTDKDLNAIPSAFPRGHAGENRVGMSVSVGKTSTERYLTPEEWRTRFEEMYRSRL